MLSMSRSIHGCGRSEDEPMSSLTSSPLAEPVEPVREAAGEAVGARVRASWRALTANHNVTIGLVIVVAFVLLALIGPLFVGVDPNTFGSDTSASPSTAHLLGTTSYGQDVLAQVVVGSRVSVALGFITGIVCTIISVIVGLVSGYYGGLTDEGLSV